MNTLNRIKKGIEKATRLHNAQVATTRYRGVEYSHDGRVVNGTPVVNTSGGVRELTFRGAKYISQGHDFDVIDPNKTSYMYRGIAYTR